MKKTIMTSENIMKSFGREQVLRGVSLSVDENSFTAILGPSGSGKSTLLNILSGLTRPTGGKVVCNGVEITNLKEAQLADWKRVHAGCIFQNYLLLNNLTVEENIKIGIAPGRESLSFDRLVGMLDIESLLDKFPSQLSGGQQQRVAIARAVIKCPDLLYCDEATGALDEANSKKVIRLLHTLQYTFGLTVLFTTHNPQIAETADRVITVKDGCIAKDVSNEKPIMADDMMWG